MNTIQDSDTKIKMLEMHVARLEREMSAVMDELEDVKRYILKIVSHQTMITEKIKLWPYVVVNKTAGGEEK